MTSSDNTYAIENLNNQYLDFYKFLNLINIDNKELSNFLDISNMFNSFGILYRGMAGKSKENIDKHTNLKHLISVTSDMIKPSHKRTAILVRKGYTFNEDYMNTFRRNKVFSNIPTNDKMVNVINKKILKKFKRWPNEGEIFINNFPSDNPRLWVRNQSYFEGVWKTPFEKENTILGNFNIGDDKIVELQMMHKDINDGLFSYYDNIKDCYLISIPYENDYSLLIIMPRIPQNKKQLIEFCKDCIFGTTISDFYNKNGQIIRFTHLSMPKFNFKYTWKLDESLLKDTKRSKALNNYCPYMKYILDENLNLQNMITNFDTNSDSITIESKTEIDNKESGTFVTSTTDIFEYDFVQKTNFIMNIDRGFIFAILNQKSILCSIGLFNGI